MPNKKTNLGKSAYAFNNIDEFTDSILKDVEAFKPEMAAILRHFNGKHPYDVFVLAHVIAEFFSITTLNIEKEYPEFEKTVFALYENFLYVLRENRKKNPQK